LFQILLLDDEQLALTSVQWLIPWDQLGVSRVLLADDVEYAQELLRNFQIDLIICDIEMPRMNGIEFAEWLKKTWPSVEIIMLTGHMNFTYAQQALRAGCLDYLLKPVTSEVLMQSVQKALQYIENKRTVENNSSRWKDMSNIHRERFIRDVITRTVVANTRDIDNAASRLGLAERHNMCCRPIYIAIRHWAEDYSPEDKALYRFGVCNVAHELIVESDQDGVTLQLDSDRIFVILENVTKSAGQLQMTCLKLIKMCNKYLNCDITCYIGQVVELAGLADEVDAVMSFPMEHAVPYNEVYFTGNRPSSAQVHSWETDIQRWFQMLEAGQFQNVLDDVQKVLVNQEKRNLLNILELKQLQQDFTQRLYLWLERNNLQANRLYQDKRSLVLAEQSLYSISQFCEWLDWVLMRAKDVLDGVSHEDLWIKQVKDYISLHISDDINRKMIADAVYVTQDYLSRIFKKKTGVGLAEYIIQKRITLAKQLLTQTDSPIGDIAMQLGYASFSHFSKVFKDNTGQTPIIFRQEHKRSIIHD